MRRAVATANPLALLAIGLLPVVGSLLVQTVRAGLVVIAVYLLAALTTLDGIRRLAWRLGLVALAAVSVTYSTWLLGGHDGSLAALGGLRILVLAVPGALLSAYIDPTRLGDHLAQQLRLPPRPVAAATGALTRVEALGAVWQQLDRTRRSRGFGPSRNPLSHLASSASMTFALLVSALRGATQMSLAMDARGFARAQHRTWAEPAHWSRTDTVVLVVGALVTVVLPAYFWTGVL